MLTFTQTYFIHICLVLTFNKTENNKRQSCRSTIFETFSKIIYRINRKFLCNINATERSSPWQKPPTSTVYIRYMKQYCGIYMHLPNATVKFEI